MKRDWFALFDQLKQLGQFRSDAQVAEFLGVTRSQISAWRNRKTELGTVTKLQLLHALGQDDLSSALESLLADEDRVGNPLKPAANVSALARPARRAPRKRPL